MIATRALEDSALTKLHTNEHQSLNKCFKAQPGKHCSDGIKKIMECWAKCTENQDTYTRLITA